MKRWRSLLFCALDHAAYRLSTGNSEAFFKDEGQIGAYASGAVEGLRQAEIINGYADGSYRPKGSTTRVEAATIIYNLMGL